MQEQAGNLLPVPGLQRLGGSRFEDDRLWVEPVGLMEHDDGGDVAARLEVAVQTVRADSCGTLGCPHFEAH